MKTEDDIVNAMYAGITCMLVETTERNRLHNLIVKVVTRLNNERTTRRATPPETPVPHMLVTWNYVEGLTANSTVVAADGTISTKSAFKDYNTETRKSAALEKLVTDVGGNQVRGTQDPVTALKCLEALDTVCDDKPEAIIVLMHDLHECLNADYHLRVLLDNIVSRQTWAPPSCRRLLICGQPTLGFNVHPDVKHLFTPVHLPLPTADDLAIVVRNLCIDVDDVTPVTNITPALQTELTERLCGLTEPVAENVAALTIVSFHAETRVGCPLTDDLAMRLLRAVDRQKADLLQSNMALRYVPVDALPNLDALRGFDGMIEFIRARTHYTPEARAQHIDPPRGIGMVGLPGTGKSHAAKLIAKLLGVPLFILDIGALFGSLLGESEFRLREVLHIIEAQQRCVLLIDEADKSLGGMQGSTTDGGVASRLFAGILNWLQERKDNSYVIMTMNRVTGVPPELFRPGRFDQIFGVVEPDAATCVDILKAHFSSRHCEPTFTEAEWNKLGSLAHGTTTKLVGAALEEVVKSSMATAFTRSGCTSAVPTYAEVVDALGQAVKYDSSSLHGEELATLRNFITKNCRPVGARANLSDAIKNASTRPARRTTG